MRVNDLSGCDTYHSRDVACRQVSRKFLPCNAQRCSFSTSLEISADVFPPGKVRLPTTRRLHDRAIVAEILLKVSPNSALCRDCSSKYHWIENYIFTHPSKFYFGVLFAFVTVISTKLLSLPEFQQCFLRATYVKLYSPHQSLFTLAYLGAYESITLETTGFRKRLMHEMHGTSADITLSLLARILNAICTYRGSVPRVSRLMSPWPT